MFILCFFRTILPLLAIVAGLVYILLTMLGGAQRQSLLDRVYLFRLDATNIRPYKMPETIQYNANLSPAHKIGLENHYYFYIWNYCESSKYPRVKKCSSPNVQHYFDPVRILRKNLYKGVVVKLPSGTKSFIDRIRIVTICMTVTSSLAFILTILSLIFKLVAFAFKYDDKVPRGTVGITALMSFIASCFITSIPVSVKKMNDDNAGYLKVKVIYGSLMLIYTWIATFTILIAYVSSLIAYRHIQKRKTETEKLY